jgi:thiol:disulfide interchange protein DsbD
MKLTTRHRLTLIGGLIFSLCVALLVSPAAAAIEFDEVRDFDDVFAISASAASRDQVEIRWQIEADYYLYNNKFLRFTALTEGVELGEPQVPRGQISFDELLGEEVEKYHGQLTVTLPLVSVNPGVDSLQLRVRSQG